MLVPAMAVTGPAFDRLMSDTADTFSDSVAWLLAVFGSGVALTVVARSLISICSVAVTSMVMVARPGFDGDRAVRLPRSQCTTLAGVGGLQVPWLVVTVPMLNVPSLTMESS